MHVPPFDGRASPFANYKTNYANSRSRIPTLDPAKRPANLLLNLVDIAREVRMAVGKDRIGNNDGAQQIPRILRRRFAPDAICASYPEVAKFMDFERPDQTMAVYLMKFEVSCEKSEARMVLGCGFPDEYVSIFARKTRG